MFVNIKQYSAESCDILLLTDCDLLGQAMIVVSNFASGSHQKNVKRVKLLCYSL